MSMLFEKGRQGFADGGIDWDTDTIKAALLDLHTSETAVKAITGATNATPIVVTATGHGFSNGDLVYINGVLGNLAANGFWKIANVATNTFELQRPDGTNAVGSGAYTSGGYAVCLGPSGSGDNWDDFDGCLVGSEVTLANKTATNGVLDADDTSFTSVTGNSVEAIGIRKDTGTPSTSKMIALITGHQIVTVAKDASTSDTTLWVEPLPGGIPSGTVLTFSNGQAATLSGAASAGARSLSVSSLAAAIAAGHRALSPQTNGGLPTAALSSTTVNVTWDNGANKIAKL